MESPSPTYLVQIEKGQESRDCCLLALLRDCLGSSGMTSLAEGYIYKVHELGILGELNAFFVVLE